MPVRLCDAPDLFSFHDDLKVRASKVKTFKELLAKIFDLKFVVGISYSQ